jgi:hypothetical protein
MAYPSLLQQQNKNISYKENIKWSPAPSYSRIKLYPIEIDKHYFLQRRCKMDPSLVQQNKTVSYREAVK